MNKFFLVSTIAVLVAVGLMAQSSSSYADVSGTGYATVFVTVNPNITISIPTAQVSAGTIQTGTFNATIDFRIDANTEAVSLAIAASNLYKGGVVTLTGSDGTTTSPIPLVTAVTAGVGGALIQPTNANPFQGQLNQVPFSTVGQPVNGFPTLTTVPVSFESTQVGVFSQDVFVKVWWTQPDPEKPVGLYSGVVQVTAHVLPSS